MYKVCATPLSCIAAADTETRVRGGGWLARLVSGRRIHLSGWWRHPGRSARRAGRSFAWRARVAPRWMHMWSAASASPASLAAGARPQLLPAVRLQGRLRWRPELGLWHDLRQSGGRQEVRAQVPPDAVWHGQGEGRRAQAAQGEEEPGEEGAQRAPAHPRVARTHALYYWCILPSTRAHALTAGCSLPSRRCVASRRPRPSVRRCLLGSVRSQRDSFTLSVLKRTCTHGVSRPALNAPRHSRAPQREASILSENHGAARPSRITR